MSCRRIRVMLLIVLVLGPAVANSQPAPPPGYRERELAQIIRDSGHDCVRVERIEATPNSPPGFESFRPEVATCNNGKRFLVARSGRSGGNVRPVVRPLF